jgi:predicted transcriptional regulator
MPEDERSTSANREFTAQIVAAYVRRNQIAASDLSALISTVYEALGRLGAPPAEPVAERTPAVSIRRSITPDAVVCLDCGWRGQMLRRHLTTAHGLSVEQYRARWKLAADHAMTAPSYSVRRSAMAKQLGLGRAHVLPTGGAAVPEATSGETEGAPATGAPQPARRRRPPRSVPPSTK